MKFLKQATYIRYVSKFVQISTQAFSESLLEDPLKIEKGLELVSRLNISYDFLIKILFYNIT